MYDPIKAQLRWTTKLKHVAAAGRAVFPKDEQVADLARNANALHYAIAGGAPDTAEVLIARCRNAVTRVRAVDDASVEDLAFVDAWKADARKALNRVANMIRRNDPDPSEPKVVAR